MKGRCWVHRLLVLLLHRVLHVSLLVLHIVLILHVTVIDMLITG